MSTTQPIRNKKQLERFKNYYQKENFNYRNYALIIVSLNTALRINDILHLKTTDVFQGKTVRTHLVIKERKTGKENRILLNSRVRSVLNQYYKHLKKTEMYKAGNIYLFPSPRKKQSPLSRFQAYRIISDAASSIGIEEPVSCHSMRKTFGYHAWKQGTDPIVIMILFNHSSLNITKRYLCIEQDDKDAVLQNTKI